MPLAFRAKEKCLGEVLLPYLTALDCLPAQRKIGVRPQAKISLVVESFPVRSGPGPRCVPGTVVPSVTQTGLASTLEHKPPPRGWVSSPLYLGTWVTFPGLPLLRPRELAHLSRLGRGTRPPAARLPRPGSAPSASCSEARPRSPRPDGPTQVRTSRSRPPGAASPPAHPGFPGSGPGPGSSALLTRSQRFHGGGGGRLAPVRGASRSGPRRRRRRRVTLDLRNIGARGAPRRRGHWARGGGGARAGDRDPAPEALPASATTKTIPAAAAAASGSGSGSQRARPPGGEGARGAGRAPPGVPARGGGVRGPGRRVHPARRGAGAGWGGRGRAPEEGRVRRTCRGRARAPAQPCGPGRPSPAGLRGCLRTIHPDSPNTRWPEKGRHSRLR